MSIKLSNIRPVSRMKNDETGQEVNMKKGRRAERGVDYYFYLLKGTRVYVSDFDISTKWKRVAS